MPSRSPSKQRLEELIALARTYRGWSSKDLARELGRDVHHLVPDSGVPKLDIVIALADALDWTVQDVVDDLCGNVPAPTAERPSESWADLDRAAYSAYCEGRFEDVIAIARRELAAATTADERARAFGRQYLGWEALGNYLNAAAAAQRGLGEPGVSPEITFHLRNHLAHTHYLLGRYLEAEGVASTTLELVARGVLTSRHLDSATGFAHFVRGSARKEMAVASSAGATTIAALAIEDLRAAESLELKAFEEHGQPDHQAIAHICRGAMIDAMAIAGEMKPVEALDHITDALSDVVDPSSLPREGLLEAWGWWCVFGAGIALRAPIGDDARSSYMAIFTNKADEIAERLGNWALRERVWAIELARRSIETGEPVGEWLVDREDIRQISGAMARFPAFRPLGWQVLRSVSIRDLGQGQA